jgi:hypothetical protein
MSRLTGDRNPQQQQTNQNQQIIQPLEHQQSFQNIRAQSIPQQKLITIPSSGSFIIINNTNISNPNDGSIHQLVNPIQQNSIRYSTPPPGTPGSSESNQPNVFPSASQTTSIAYSDPSSPIANKRLKLELGDKTISAGNTNPEDLANLKSRILDHKLQRIKGLVEK